MTDGHMVVNTLSVPSMIITVQDCFSAAARTREDPSGMQGLAQAQVGALLMVAALQHSASSLRNPVMFKISLVLPLTDTCSS
jgi:hypothetical protein